MYEIHDTYGAPQCGCEVIICETWLEVVAYFTENGNEALERLQRLHEGYATIVERD